MKQFKASRLIDAPAVKIYDIISDYQEGHPKILPTPPFGSLEVLEGGRGAGTRIRVSMEFARRLQTFTAVISEPEPGRRLVETIPESGMVTTFTVVPVSGKEQTLVTITTEMPVKPGLAGKLEAYFTRRLLRHTYNQELEKLANVVEEPLFTG